MCDHNHNKTAADRSPDIKALLKGLLTNWRNGGPDDAIIK